MKYAKLVQNVFIKISSIVKPHTGIRNHGVIHWKKVAAVGAELADLNNEPKSIIHAVIAAGLIHDIGRIHDSTRKDPDHGKRSVAIAKKMKLLHLMEVNRDYWQDIYDAVNNHTHGKKTKSIIGKYLWDADRLCLMGFNKKTIEPDKMSSQVWQKLCE